MYETKPVAVCVSRCGQKQTFLAALVAGAVLAVAAHAHAQSIGVAPCDDYLAKLEACVPKMSPQTQSMERGILDSMRKAWTNIAKDASQKPYLEETCKKFMDNIKTKLETCSLP
jgi:hypothetical protein